MLTFILVNNSCEKDELLNSSVMQLKAAKKNDKELIKAAQRWFDNNTEQNQFKVLESSDFLKWENAVVNDLDSIVVVEVPIKLKEEYSFKVAGNEKLNVEYRLLIFLENDSYYSLMEYFISEKDLAYLHDTEKLRYSKKENDFEGIIVLVDTCDEVVSTEWVSKKVKSGEVKLKSGGSYCVWLVWIYYESGRIEYIMPLYCVQDSQPLGGGGSGTANNSETTQMLCNCSVCPICGGCLNDPTTNTSNSSTTTEGDDFTESQITYDCPICTCPKIETTIKFESNEKVMCIYTNLIGTSVRFYNPLVTTFLMNFSNGLSLNPGDIVFDIKDLGSDKYGQCVKNGDKFEVSLNSNFLNNRSPIEIAKTLIHEILHAKIGHDLNLSPSLFMNDFTQYINDGTLNQHDLMMDYYVEPMVNFLRDYDILCGYSIPNDDYYRALSLSGLEKNITIQEMKKLTEAQNYFRNRGLDCN
jgi:hypothetical protein